jgi:hypothetical protein
MRAKPRFALRNRHTIDPLESRITPASVFHYTDGDGDQVTITSSIGDLNAPGVVTVTDFQLQLLDFSGGGFDGTNLSSSVVRGPGGDGLANVGYINSTGHDLGTVSVKGDLGQIDAGSGSATVPAIKSLTVNSLGRLGTDTQAAGGSLESDITGSLGALTVKHDVAGDFVLVGGTNGTIGAVTIGGSLIGGTIFSFSNMGVVKIGHDVQGGSDPDTGFIFSGGNLAGVTLGGSLIGGSGGASGEILSSGDMGGVTIAHDVQGGSGDSSGFVNSTGKLADVTIGGSLLGGLGEDSGEINSGSSMGMVKIGHDVQGGSGLISGLIQSGSGLAGVSIGGSLVGGPASATGAIAVVGDVGVVKISHDVQGGSGGDSGFIDSSGKLAGVTIGGSLLGGVGNDSGVITSNGDMGAIKIGQDLMGGSITGSASLDSSGEIETTAGRILSVTLGGSIVSGNDNSSGALTNNATILSADDIGSLTVKGNLIGNVTLDGASLVVISARGQAVQGTTTDLAIGKISIGGRVEYANIFAGYNIELNPVNGDAQIGAVSVGGDWIASNLVAGAMNAASGNTNFGNGNDASIGGGTTGIIATISRVSIGGQVFGTPISVSVSDQFGFVAERIGSLKIGVHTIALIAGANNDNLGVGETADVVVHEV